MSLLMKNMKPLLITAELFGMLNFNNNNFKRHKRNFVIIFIFITLETYTIYGRVAWDRIFEAPTISMNCVVSIIKLGFIAHAIVMLSNLKVQQLSKLILDLDRFDVEILRMDKTVKLDVNGVGYQFFVSYVILMVINFYDYTFWFYLQDRRIKWYYVIDYVYNNYVIILVFLEFYLLKGMMVRWRVFNNCLESSRLDLLKIDKFMMIHNILWDSVEGFNSIFTWNIFMMLVWNILQTLLTFAAILLDYFPSFMRIVFGNLFCYLSIHLVLVWITSKIIEEGKRTTVLAYSSLNRPAHYNNPLIEAKLEIMIRRCKTLIPNFSAAGFFNLNYAMIFMFFNMMVSYVIVIIQYAEK